MKGERMSTIESEVAGAVGPRRGRAGPDLIGLAFAFVLVGSLVAGPAAAADPVQIDCRDDAECPRVVIAGAPPQVMPDGSAPPLRGVVDAKIRRDPEASTLYMTYTHIFAEVSSPELGSQYDGSPGVALASSRDGGKSWVFDTMLRPTVPEADPVSGKPGYACQETSAITAATDEWYLAHLRFHNPVGGGNNRRPDSFHIELARAPTPQALADAPRVMFAGSLAAKVWSDYRLDLADPSLARCSLWLDSELLYKDDHLYFMAVCVPFEGGTRRSDLSEYSVFELSTKDEDFGTPRYLGALMTGEDAARLGAEELSKGNLSYARDGTLLFLTAPVFRGERFEEYPGCFVFEVVSLDRPRLRRDAAGAPIARAVVRSSDAVPSSASCVYHADSATGIVLTRRVMDVEKRSFEWSLHATGYHP
jgi:hypothetical protein